MLVLIAPTSNRNPLHLVEIHLVAPAIVKLGGAVADVGGEEFDEALLRARRRRR